MQDLSAALATRNLQDAIGNSGSNQLFILQSADVVERQAVCGNLVCEAGERPSTNNSANGGGDTSPAAWHATACTSCMSAVHGPLSMVCMAGLPGCDAALLPEVAAEFLDQAVDPMCLSKSCSALVIMRPQTPAR